MKKLDNEAKNKLKSLINKSEKAVLICTDKGVGVVGPKVGIMSILAIAIEYLHDNCNMSKEDIDTCVKTAFMDHTEFDKIIGKIQDIKDLLDKLED